MLEQTTYTFILASDYAVSGKNCGNRVMNDVISFSCFMKEIFKIVNPSKITQQKRLIFFCVWKDPLVFKELNSILN